MYNDAECLEMRSHASCLPDCIKKSGEVIPSCLECAISRKPAQSSLSEFGLK